MTTQDPQQPKNGRRRIGVVALVVVGAMVSGCTPSAPATLRASCDSLAQVMKDSKEGDYSGTLAKARTISDAGDESTKQVLSPFIAALSKVDSDHSATADLMAAGVKVAMACGAVGSAGWGAASSSVPAAPAPSSAAAVTPMANECLPISDAAASAILSDSGRTATGSAAIHGGKGAWLVALKLRSGEVDVWVTDSITTPSLVLSVDEAAKAISGWGLAGSDKYDPTRVAVARACVS